MAFNIAKTIGVETMHKKRGTISTVVGRFGFRGFGFLVQRVDPVAWHLLLLLLLLWATVAKVVVVHTESWHHLP